MKILDNGNRIWKMATLRMVQFGPKTNSNHATDLQLEQY